MKILGLKPGHDGTIALLHGNNLLFSIEGEKKSFPRFSPITVSSVLDAASATNSAPDCIAVGGWPKGFYSNDLNYGMGYWGVGPSSEAQSEIRFFGHHVKLFEGSHESSHIWGAFGMSPFADTYPCYALVWEGNIGRFYLLNSPEEVIAYPQILDDPGNKYAFIFALADPTYPDDSIEFRFQDAGKLMALAAFSEDREPNRDEKKLIDWVLAHPQIAGSRAKKELANSPFYNIGVQSDLFKNLARAHSDAIFEKFRGWAAKNLKPGLPLVIGGGCGLNCDWNAAWVRSGMFSDVFVPPCVNDSGSAIGSAIQAKVKFSGKAKINWSVYSGSLERNRDDELKKLDLPKRQVNFNEIASDLAAGEIVAVMRARCEIGPRALGNRSLLADPRDAKMLERLNRIKQREPYRPIAPICKAESSSTFFNAVQRDKYMLFFANVIDSRIPAVTHVDNSARVQMVEKGDNEFIWQILHQFGAMTGVDVLCNTSLNFNGKGFIDDVRELVAYCGERGIKRAVCDDVYLEIS